MSARSLLACKNAIQTGKIGISSDSYDGIFSLLDKYNLTSDELDDLFEWLKTGGTIIEEIDYDEKVNTENDLLNLIVNCVKKHDGIKARDIARIISRDKSEINSLLYANKEKLFVMDTDYCWYYSDKKEHDEMIERENAITQLRIKRSKEIIKEMKCVTLEEEPQMSIAILFKKHPEFRKHYTLLNEYARKDLGISFKDLLVNEGILEEFVSREKQQLENLEEIRVVVDDIVNRFKGNPMVKKIPEVFELFPEYKDYYSKASGYSRKIYGHTLQQHFIKNGIIEPQSFLSEEDILQAIDIVKNEYKFLPKETRASDVFQNSRICFEYSKTLNNPRAAKVMKMTVGNYFKQIGIVVDKYKSDEVSLVKNNYSGLESIDINILQYVIDSMIYKNVIYEKLVDAMESIAAYENEFMFDDNPIISNFNEQECRCYLRYILDLYESDEGLLSKKVNDGTLLKILFRIEDLINLSK